MRRTIVGLALPILLAGLPSTASPQELATDDQKTLYALGLAISQSLAPFALSPSEFELLKAGLSDGVLGKEKKVDLQTFRPKIQELQKIRAAAAAASERKAGQDYLERAAGEQGATRMTSGLTIITMEPGNGESPKAGDRVKVHYHGTLTDGTVFDSSVQRGEPVTFPVGGVIPCWTEGVQLMKVGGKSRLVCPSTLAYGDRGSPPRVKPGATLVFEVQLLDIVK
jgi:FKBP-type peptidyl-prolyl cis-trans isomerase FkpA/FKBP-type peptidyl-prolyl cis-trans isomerase FklB